MIELFTQLVYQPFFNFLVMIYYALRLVIGPEADMGIAVILFTIAIRVLMLPLTLSGDRSEAERRRVENKVKDIRRQFAADPVARDAHIKALMKGNQRIVLSSSANLIIQTMLALMLWRIFAKGLLGADFHLLYDFVPRPEAPLNLTFLGQYDLTKPNPTLNAIQSLLIFVLEAEIGLFSPFPITRQDVILMQFTLPVGSYLIFSQLPAGKKLFIITTLAFSIVYVTQRQLRFWWHGLAGRFSRQGVSSSEAKVDEGKSVEDGKIVKN